MASDVLAHDQAGNDIVILVQGYECLNTPIAHVKMNIPIAWLFARLSMKHFASG